MSSNLSWYKRKVHTTPRLLLADAYTIGSEQFQSDKARERSVYYMVFRRELYKINPNLFKKDDNRIIFAGIQRIIERLFIEPITHEEIDEAKKFLASAKVTPNGLKEFWFPEHLWRRIVDEFNGRVPIRIKAMPEGSVVYPNEPYAVIENVPDGFGELAAWFESKLLHTWSSSERITQDKHWLERLKDMVRMVDPTLPEEQVSFIASTMLTDFGDRAGICLMESEDQGLSALYTFPGTDTFAGGYQAWKNSNETPGVCFSVNALAHRNVQAYEYEKDAYVAIFEKSPGEFASMVADCYSYRVAVKKYLVELAKRAIAENTGTVVVGRPDSGIALDEVMFLIETAIAEGLCVRRMINGREWIGGTTLRFIEGDGMTHESMWEIMMAMIEKGYIPWEWGLFGQGGGQRNNLKRDNLSAKYALCAMGNNYDGVVKFSDTFGKTTLPGPFKILRSKDAFDSKRTIVFAHEEGDDAMVMFYDGTIERFFGPGMMEDFLTIKNRANEQFNSYPKTLHTEDNHGYPASEAIINKRKELLLKYAPDKDTAAY